MQYVQMHIIILHLHFISISGISAGRRKNTQIWAASENRKRLHAVTTCSPEIINQHLCCVQNLQKILLSVTALFRLRFLNRTDLHHIADRSHIIMLRRSILKRLHAQRDLVILTVEVDNLRFDLLTDSQNI